MKKPRKNKITKDNKRYTKCITDDSALASLTKRCDKGIKKMRSNEILECKSANKVHMLYISCNTAMRNLPDIHA